MDASRLTPEYISERVTVDPISGCWNWRQSVNRSTGYGQVWFRPYTAHRLSYLLHRGDPGSLVVRHSCHNKVCCNPSHLVLGTHRDNYHDSAEAHALVSAARRGRPARNSIPVKVDGVTYPSKVDAMRSLRVSPATLARLISA